MTPAQNPRPSALAGQWYPGEAGALADSVDSYISAAGPADISGRVLGVIAPHAGHLYSGPVAGYAFAAIKDLDPDVVVVISPMHHPEFSPLLTTGHDAYLTPLGSVPVDREAIAALDEVLQERLGFGLHPVLHDSEHSLEIELPFLQRSIGDRYRLVPIMLRDQAPHTVQVLGESLAEVLGKQDILFVGSTDLSHYYPQEVANRLDLELLRRLETFDPLAVLEADEEGVGFACGRGAAAAVLWATCDLGADRVKVLHYATSGDVTGDFSAVVGYGAAAIFSG
jgi:MEMO1 family protein